MPLGVTWDWLLGTLAPALGSAATVVLVAYYARLYRVNREHLRAAQAEYAPALDVSREPFEDCLAFHIANRGRGAARDVKLHARIQIGGRVYQHRALFTPSLGPGRVFRDPDPVRDYSSRFDPSVLTDLRVSLLPDGEVTKTCGLCDLFGRASDESNHETAYVRIRVTYTDVMEQNEFEEVIDDDVFELSGDGLDEVFPDYARRGRMGEGLRGRALQRLRQPVRRARRRLEQLWRLRNQPRLYEAEISGVEPVDID